jgi:molecular chaperone GrpE
MPLGLLQKTLFPQAFVIDEAPEEIYVPARETVQSKAARTDEEDGENDPLRTLGLSDVGNRDDLFSQVARLMLDQVRLEQKARVLESGGQRGDDEFARFVRQALPFLDNFWRLLEMAREQPPSEELKNWLASVESLYFRIVRLLENYGLVFISSLGKEVNLDYHEVVEYRPSREAPHNHIIKELEKGAVFRSRLLRDAKVVVACNPS